MIIFGVLDSENCHIDLCKTLQGAKRIATREGYETVSARNANNYYVDVICKKINGKWVDV